MNAVARTYVEYGQARGPQSAAHKAHATGSRSPLMTFIRSHHGIRCCCSAVVNTEGLAPALVPSFPPGNVSLSPSLVNSTHSGRRGHLTVARNPASVPHKHGAHIAAQRPHTGYNVLGPLPELSRTSSVCDIPLSKASLWPLPAPCWLLVAPMRAQTGGWPRHCGPQPRRPR